MLCTALAGTERAGRPEEYFDNHPRNEAAWRNRSGSPDDRPYFDIALQAGTTPNGVFGLKLLWHQGRALTSALLAERPSGEARDLQSEEPENDGPTPRMHALLSARIGTPHYIWMRRNNRVAQAISYYRAAKTDVWRLPAEGRAPELAANPVAFDYAAIDSFVRRIEMFERGWYEFFMRLRLPALVIVYEDFTQAYEPTVRGVLGYLGLDDGTTPIPTPTYRKQADDSSAEVDWRYREMKAAESRRLPPVRPPTDQHKPRGSPVGDGSTLRVAIYAIALNEIKHVQRFVRACSEADAIIVADTGSTDGTVQALQDAGAVVHSIAVKPWRFDDARNVSLALVPPDIDVCFCLDLDEVPAPGWRAALQRGWTPGTTLGRHRFVLSRLPNGTPAVEMAAVRIHARFGYRWRHMCHEILVPDRVPHPREAWLPDLLVDHQPDLSKPRTAYLRLLESAVAESPNDPRDVFLLARDYVALRRWREAEDLLRRYLVLLGETMPLQRATGLRRLAKCRVGLGDHADAVACLRQGLSMAPELRDLWLDLADILADHGEWQESFEASQRGLALPLGPSAIPNEPEHAGGRPYYRASVAALRLGHHAQARALAEQANAREPGHKMYLDHWRRLSGGQALEKTRKFGA